MNITGEQAFISWSAAAGRWARWIKPSLLAPAYFVNDDTTEPLPNVGWLPAPNETALLIDLPGLEAVRTGVALSHRGYCPVPMFNTTLGRDEIFDATEVADALLLESTRLGAPKAGPPVFLLDSRRAVEGVQAQPGQLDNRWFVFASDLPTAAALQSAGLRRLLVVTEQVQLDLRDALARHGGSIELEVIDPKTELRSPFPKPRWLALRALSSLVHHAGQNADGSFGHGIPAYTDWQKLNRMGGG